LCYLRWFLLSEKTVAVVGGGGVGKTAITLQFIGNYFVEEYDPTVEESYRTQTTIDGEPAVLEIIDTAGQEEYNAIKDAHIVKGQGFLLVFSLTSRSSFDELDDIHERIYRLKEKDTATDNIPIVIAGNKCDLENDRCVAIPEGEALANSWRCKFHATSALSKVGVEDAFFDIVRLIRSQSSSRPSENHAGGGGGRRRLCTLL